MFCHGQPESQLDEVGLPENPSKHGAGYAVTALRVGASAATRLPGMGVKTHLGQLTCSMNVQLISWVASKVTTYCKITCVEVLSSEAPRSRKNLSPGRPWPHCLCRLGSQTMFFGVQVGPLKIGEAKRMSKSVNNRTIRSGKPNVINYPQVVVHEIGSRMVYPVRNWMNDPQSWLMGLMGWFIIGLTR